MGVYRLLEAIGREGRRKLGRVVVEVYLGGGRSIREEFGEEVGRILKGRGGWLNFGL